MKSKKKPRRREPTARELREIIPPIPDTPENVARALFRRPAHKPWRFLERPPEHRKQP